MEYGQVVDGVSRLNSIESKSPSVMANGMRWSNCVIEGCSSDKGTRRSFGGMCSTRVLILDLFLDG